jgi:uncharacterized protein
MTLQAMLAHCTGFEWDEGNAFKNWEKHQVRQAECEQLFFNDPLVVMEDAKYSDAEPRFFALGCSDTGRPLFVVFTVRISHIRVISARPMNRKEREIYAAQ